MKLFNLLVASFTFFGCSETIVRDNDLKRLELNGKIKSMVIQKYKTEKKFGEYRVMERISGKENRMYTFDEYGNITQQYTDYRTVEKSFDTLYLRIYQDGRLTAIQALNSDKTVIKNINLKYHVNGMVAEISENYGLDVRSQKSYQYDDKGNLVEYIMYMQLNREVALTDESNIVIMEKYQYDNQSRMIQKDMYPNTGKLLFSYTYEHDSSNNVIEEMIKVPWAEATESYKYEYDKKGNLRMKKFFKDGVNTNNFIYSYDEQGNLLYHGKTSMIFSLSAVAETYTYRYMYDYDDKNNWIKKVVIGGTQENYGEYIITRHIEYY